MNIAQINFCAAECHRQQSGELSVGWMCEAFSWFAYPLPPRSVRPFIVQELGQTIEPIKNQYGFRKMPVYFDNDPTKQALNADQVPHALESLLDHGVEYLTPEQLYQEFETIHPFNDGNGRVGAILFNYWNYTLNYPIIPPMFVTA